MFSKAQTPHERSLAAVSDCFEKFETISNELKAAVTACEDNIQLEKSAIAAANTRIGEQEEAQGKANILLGNLNKMLTQAL